MIKLELSGSTLEDLQQQLIAFMRVLGNKTDVIETRIPLPVLDIPAPLPATITPPVPLPVVNIPAPLPATITPPVVIEIPEIDEIDDEEANQEPISTSDRDSRGIPWDSRIHATSRSVTMNGTWRYRRNTDEALIEKVEEQLRNRIKNTAPTPEAPVVVPTPVVPAAATPVAPVVVPTPVVPAAGLSAHTFESFKTSLPYTLAILVQQGKLTHEYIEVLKGYFKVAQIWETTDNQKLEMFDQFVAAGIIAKVEQ